LQNADHSSFDDDLPRPIVALGIDYPDEYTTPVHSHRRAQLLHGSTGVVLVSTESGAWMMPPDHGLWIPPGVKHDVKMLGRVSMNSLYIEPDAAQGIFDHCQVVGISGLMRQLLMEATTLAPLYDENGRDAALMSLLLFELRRLVPVKLALPLPMRPAMAEHCRRFLLEPTPHDTIDGWAEELGMSRRSFTRIFKLETGMSFVTWRQQACLLAALPRLASGVPVTRVAIDLGYDNPASFTTMFKRLLGTSPRAYLSSQAS
jgi:AraC-like DNA-binding protein